jgi:hypothetical protein
MAWPTTYGKLQLQNFGEKPESSVLRSEFETGPPKESIIRSRVMVSRPVTYVFTLADYNTWKTWFASEANGGQWFNWVDPTDGSTILTRIVRSEFDARLVDAGQGSEPNVEVTMIFESWGL